MLNTLRHTQSIVILTLLSVCNAFWCTAQKYSTPNIVPNPGFELIDQPPVNWFNLGQDFTRCIKYWSSPTDASPDAYGPGITVPANWARKGFGKVQPRSGEYMAGMTLYGCDGGKPHCREYIQIQLSEPLVLGQKYYIEFYLRHLANSLESNNIGVYFNNRTIKVQGDPVLKFTPQFNTEFIITCDDYWERISGEIIAMSESDNIIIGNFYSDAATQTRTTGSDNFGYAYYYIDDITIQKIPPLLPVPVKSDDIRLANLDAGQIILLKYIFFESDKSELLPRSFQELDKLLELLQQNPGIRIEVRGHTDNLGDEKYNLRLSKDRAKSVVDYLRANDIAAARLKYKGFGSAEPKSTNDTEEGRSLNRRVEIRILDNP